MTTDDNIAAIQHHQFTIAQEKSRRLTSPAWTVARCDTGNESPDGKASSLVYAESDAKKKTLNDADAR